MKKSKSTLSGVHGSRRQFLRTSAASAAAAVAAPYVLTSDALGAPDRAAASDRIVMAIIGAGGQGSSDMGNMLGSKDTQYVAACDVRKNALRGAKGRIDGKYGNKDCKTYNDFREVLARDDIDAINCGTPDHWHAIISITACRSGKDVYCQKPLTLTIAEGRAMVNAARRYGRVVSGGSQRVIGNYGRLAKDAQSGIIGEVREAWAGVGGPSRPCYLGAQGDPAKDGIDWDLWLGPAPWAPYHPYRCGRAYGLGGKGFRTWYDYSGGMMTDWGGHTFGGALYGMGKLEEGPVEVIPPDKDHKQLTFVFADGAKLYHNGNPYGSNPCYKGTHGIVGRTVEGTGELHKRPIPYYAEGTRSIYADFLHCVRTRQRPFRDVERSHRTASVCHLGNIAYILKRPLKWDPIKEEFPGDTEANRMRDRPKRGPWTL